MELRLVARTLAVFASLAAFCFTPATARAQVAGDNINMVSGTEWPGGDPFLQRQNEPTIAVSSANPQHLMAGANDYRSVDIPDPAYGAMVAGDAWLGVFKSYNGGQTWKSVLMPGYPQDVSPEGLASPLKTLMVVPVTFPDDTNQRGKSVALPASADPVMRAGTDGLFYYLGINFARDKSVGRIFVSRYIDQNNKENGDPTKTVKNASGVPIVTPTDPIKYLGTTIIARSTDSALTNGGKNHIFLDKPWMAVDVPRGNQTCTVPDPDVAGRTKKILAGTVYVAWAQFAPKDVSSDIMITWSNDCAKTWSTPLKLNSKNTSLNQGVSIAIEPTTGRVLVTWRRVKSGTQTDAIMATRSKARQRYFSLPRVISQFIPFDQQNGSGRARTQTMPSMAISSDGAGKSWVHVAWAARGAVDGASQIYLSTAQILPPPTGDNDPDDAETLDAETRVRWSKADVEHERTLKGDHDKAPRYGAGAVAVVNDGSVTDDASHTFTVGHKYMPSLTFSQGRLVLFYYDSRLDHTRRYYRPTPFPYTDAKFYNEELGPIGDPVTGGVSVFGPEIDDGIVGTQTRHTIDVRVATAAFGPNPTFQSTLVSRFPFGMRGDEQYLPAKQAGFVAGSSMGVVPDAITVLEPSAVAGGKPAIKVLQQLQLNIPGFPMFKGGSTAFMGDYIDIQGQNFKPTGGGKWAFNVASTPAPVFHAVWTSNQDVKVPVYWDNVSGSYYDDWTKYTPVSARLGGVNQPPLFDGGRTGNDSTAVNSCDPVSTGSRDQNIYTSRITEGLQVTSPQNVKLLTGATVPVGFVVAALNSTAVPMTVTFQAPATIPGAEASFTTDFGGLAKTSLAGIVIAPNSGVYRTLFVRQTGLISAPTFSVTVQETGTCAAAAACRAGTVTFNPPVALNSLVQPDNAPSISNGEVYFASVNSPNVSNPNVSNPNVSNPNVSNPNVSNPNVSNPNVSNPNVSNPNISNPNVSNPNVSNPNVSNPNVSNPNVSNPNVSNAPLADPVSDLNYTITNDGNTTTSYHVKVVGDLSTAPINGPLQLIVSKTYKTPVAVGCNLREVANDQVVVSVPDIKGAIVSPDAPASGGSADPNVSNSSNPNVSNATVALAPGESAVVTLRGDVSAADMAKVGAALTPAPVPASVPPSNTTTFRNWGTPGTGTGTTPFIKTATSILLQKQLVGNIYRYAATVTPGTGPTGSVSFIVAQQVLAVVALSGGTATFTPNPQLGPDDIVVAYYPGDANYASSSSNSAPALARPLNVRATINANYSGNLSEVSVVVQDASGWVSTADVRINGLQLSYTISGIYHRSLPQLVPGDQINLVVTDGGSSVTAGAQVPGVPEIISVGTGGILNGNFPMPVTFQAAFPAPLEFYARASYVTQPGNTSNVKDSPAMTGLTSSGQTASYVFDAVGQPTTVQFSMESKTWVQPGGNVDLASSVLEIRSFHSYSVPVLVQTGTVPLPTMTRSRYELPVAAINGNLHAMGGMATATGMDPFRVKVVDILGFNSAGWSASWGVGADMPTFIQGLTAAVVGNSAYVLSGKQMLRYDIGNTWYTLPTPTPGAYTMQQPLSHTFLRDGVPHVFVYDGDYTPTFLEYSPASDAWTELVVPYAQAQLGTRHDAASAVLDNRLYVVGGYNLWNFAVGSTVLEYDPATANWKSLPNLPFDLSGASAIAYNGKLYVLGGWNGSAQSAEVLSWKYGDLDWTVEPPLPEARNSMGVAVAGGGICLVGGQGSAGDDGKAFIYYPVP
jgi:uncharacterized protein YjbI with pentapeptide repeats